MRLSKLKIAYVPFQPEFPASSRVLAPTVAPLSMVSITSALRLAGYQVDQDDLNIKFHHDNYHSNRGLSLTAFFDIKRILAFVQGREDKYLKNILEIIIEKTDWEGFDAYLFSCNSAYNPSGRMIFIGMAYLLRKRYSSKPFVLGGRFDMPLDLFKDLFDMNILDYVIKGPGEKSILSLLSVLDDGGQDFSSIGGLYWVEQGVAKSNEKSCSEIPLRPDFSGLPLNLYKFSCDNKSSECRDIFILPYRFTNGCPYSCAFCFYSHIKPFCHKEVEVVVEDLDYLKKQHNCRYFYFLENTFNFSYDYTKSLCEELIKKNLNVKWSCCVHPDNIDSELLTLMKDAGVIRIIYGFETGSYNLQKYILKNLDLDKLKNNLQISHSLGIWNGIEVICGLPHETEEDILSTISFLNDNKDYIDEYHINSFLLTLDSLYARHPDKFHLENVKTFDSDKSYHGALNFPTLNRYIECAFDEIDGLKWLDKKRQIADSYNKVLTSIKYRKMPLYDNIAYLFYFYELFSDKAKIRDIYNKSASTLLRKALFRNPMYLKNELLKVRSLKYLFNRFLYFCGINL